MTLKNISPLPNHRWVDTEDGSRTLFSEAFQETCHSPTGARAETILYYLNGCRVSEKLLSKDGLRILEVGFGLGLGFLTTYERLRNQERRWHFLSLELDEDLVEWFRKDNESHPVLGSLAYKNQGGVRVLGLETSSFSLSILVGDARITLPSYLTACPMYWDVIYQDAFSPKRNPALWTREWFELLRTHSHPDAILSTYSSSSSIRKSLVDAGWAVTSGEGFGQKRTSTRASLTGPSDPAILLHLERSPVPELTDRTIKDFV